MHQRARTDLCGGRGATRVPTATAKPIKAVQMAYFLRFVHAILLDLHVCFFAHVWYEAD